MGLRSSFGSLVELSLAGVTSGAGGGAPSTWLSDRRVQDAGRERRLRAVLAELEPRLVAVLWLAYGPQPWPSEVRRVTLYGPWPGVLLLCPSARRAFERALAARTAQAGAGEPSALAASAPGPCTPAEPHRRLLALYGLRVGALAGCEAELLGVDGGALALDEVVQLDGGDRRPPSLWRWRPLSTALENLVVMAPRPGQRGRWHRVAGEGEQRALGPERDGALDAVAAMARRGLGEWLRSPAVAGDKRLLAEMRRDARELVAEAHGALVAARRARGVAGRALDGLIVDELRQHRVVRRRSVVPVEEFAL